MKRLLLVNTLILCIIYSIGQSKVDSLIKKINNQQIGIAMQYVWYPVMNSSAGDSLITVGKPITRQMVAMITDSSRGIISHFILSSIWGKELEDAGWNLKSRVNRQLTKDSSIEVSFRGLKFYENNQSFIYAGQSELEKIKIAWLDFLNNRSIE
jgi:hypothetical protein